MALYSDPVAKLLKLGEIDVFAKWRNYTEMGIGQEHIHLAAFLTDATHDLNARIAVSRSLWRLGNEYEASRAACVQALAAQLEKAAKTDPELNGFIRKSHKPHDGRTGKRRNKFFRNSRLSPTRAVGRRKIMRIASLLEFFSE